MARSLLVTGAQAVVYINNSMFGRIAELNYRSETPRRKVQVIDHFGPFELIQQAVQITGSMRIYRIQEGGGIEAAGLIGTWDDLTREKYFSILVVNRLRDSVLFQAQMCSVESQDWRIGRGHIMGTVSFSGLQWNNETASQSETA